MPVGFKNATSGAVQVAVDAVQAAAAKHSFLSVTKQGVSAVVHTLGNPHGHVILRGGAGKTNYDPASVANAVQLISKSGATPNVIVDCSHGNSQKKHTNQPVVAAALATQISQGNADIVGVMIESNIKAGNQKLNPGQTEVEALEYGLSITDACIDLETTAETLEVLAQAVRQRQVVRCSPAACPPSVGGTPPLF